MPPMLAEVGILACMDFRIRGSDERLPRSHNSSTVQLTAASSDKPEIGLGLRGRQKWKYQSRSFRPDQWRRSPAKVVAPRPSSSKRHNDPGQNRHSIPAHHPHTHAANERRLRHFLSGASSPFTPSHHDLQNRRYSGSSPGPIVNGRKLNEYFDVSLVRYGACPAERRICRWPLCPASVLEGCPQSG